MEYGENEKNKEMTKVRKMEILSKMEKLKIPQNHGMWRK